MGDAFEKGDRLCEITLPMAIIGVEAKEAGVLAKIIVGQYQTAPAESDIALYAISQKYYMNYIADEMEKAMQEQQLAALEEVEAEHHAEELAHKEAVEHDQLDAAAMMKAIKHMINKGEIISGTGELTLTLVVGACLGVPFITT